MDKDKVLQFLKLHHDSFFEAKPYGDETGHTTPSDTKSWSQILASLLTGISGLERKKGADLADGSDVKGANTWDAIDTPRFNGVIKAGTKSDKAGKLEYLDDLPHLYFVLWDNEPLNGKERCRVWVVRTKEDKLFREMCSKWYDLRDQGVIKSDNFQLHPPRKLNTDTFRNTCGNLNYPLLFMAIWNDDEYDLNVFNPEVLLSGQCTLA
jgi:hypothetical protein